MSGNREMSLISRTIAGISLVLVVLLFSALVLTACNNDNTEKINEARAEEIVLSDAGLKPEEVARMIIKTDYDDARQIYEIDFYTSDKEYEYDLDAQSGEILKKEIEPRKIRQNAEELMETGSGTQKPETSQNQTGESLVSEEKAKEIAILHAGVSADSITKYRLARDRDDGRDVYEIEFWSANAEYDYDIDVKTGQILKFDKDIK